MSFPLVNGLSASREGQIVRSLIVRFYGQMRHFFNASKITQLGVDSRLSCRIERRKKGSIIRVGDGGVISGVLITERENSHIEIGNNVFVGGNTILDCVEQIVIEDDVLISYGCLIADSDNHSLHYESRKNDLADWKNGGQHDWSSTHTKPVRLEKGAWIGARVIILKGVTIGKGAVIGAGAVVTRDIPSYTIAAGNPARVIRELNPHER